MEMSSGDSQVRKRRLGNKELENALAVSGSSKQEDNEAELRTSKLTTNTYWLTRIVFIRSLAFIYCKLCVMLQVTFKNENTVEPII